MKGDFTRLTFDPRRRYGGVLMQQGRVQLDADWNEQLAILMHRIETEAGDLVGQSGAPVQSPGFELTARSWLVFDGENDYVFVEGRRAFSFPHHEPFTLEAWVQPASGGGGTVVSKFETEGTENRVRGEYYLAVESDLTVSFGRVERVREDGGEGADEETRAQAGDETKGDDETEGAQDAEEFRWHRLVVREARTSAPLSPDHFTHVAATFDGRESRVYLNGQLKATLKHQRRGVRARCHVLIGAATSDNEPANFFAGKLNDLRVWKAARTQEEIQRAMHRTLTGREHDLVACWRADELRGETLTDITGHHHAGLLGRGDPDSMPRVVSGELRIGAGRFYVDGLLCELDEEVSYVRQPDYPGAQLPAPAADGALYLAYLDAWLRYVSSVEDPSLRETALGGPDTAGRSQVVAQVKLLPLGDGAEPLHFDERHPRWAEFAGGETRKALMNARRQPSASYLGNQLYRVEVHTGGSLYSLPRHAAGTSAEVLPETNDDGGADVLRVAVADWFTDGVAWQTGQLVELYGAGREGDGQLGPLLRVVAVAPAEQTLTLTPSPDLPSAGDLRLRPVVTFKWSRENGSVVFPVTNVEPSSGANGGTQGGIITLSDLGRDEYTLQVGDWVELLDDAYVLQGRAEPLCQVTAIDRTSFQVTVNGALPAGVGKNPDYHPRMRRWDQKSAGDQLLVGGVVLVEKPGAWLNLESGIQITFDGAGTLRTGDYWLAPSRTLTGDIEWPRTDAGPTPQPPRGIRHHLAPLALVRFEDGAVRVRDYRRKFAPLTALESEEAHWYVKKTGDTMSGELRIDNSLHVAGEIRGGRLDATRLEARHVKAHDLEAQQLKAHDLKAHDLKAHDLEAHHLRSHHLETRELKTQEFETHELRTRRVVADDIVAGRVEAGELRGRLDPGSVGTEQLADESVTRDKLADYSITNDKLADGSVTNDKLADESVTTYRIADKAVTRAKLADDVWSIGSFPPGYSLLGASPTPPPGYTYTGSYVYAANDSAAWATKATMQVDGVTRLLSAAAAGRVYSFADSGAVFEFDPAGATWAAKSALPTDATPEGVAALDDVIYVFCDSGEVWAFDPSLVSQDQAWAQRRSVPTPRRSFGVAASGGRVYLSGGRRKVFFDLITITSRANEAYDPAANDWESRQPLPRRRYDFAAVAAADKVYAVGGDRRYFLGLFKRRLRTSVKYSTAADEWTYGLPDLPAAKSSLGACLVDQVITVFGGSERGEWSATNESYDPVTEWSRIAPLPSAIAYPGVVTLDSTAYVVGTDAANPQTCLVAAWDAGSLFYVHRKNYPDGDDNSSPDGDGAADRTSY